MKRITATIGVQATMYALRRHGKRSATGSNGVAQRCATEVAGRRARVEFGVRDERRPGRVRLHGAGPVVVRRTRAIGGEQQVVVVCTTATRSATVTAPVRVSVDRRSAANVPIPQARGGKVETIAVRTR
jgi:hypothetical protein